ncbi:hypothetical protein BGZ46_003600, partial [Entomortierella lignicola]
QLCTLCSLPVDWIVHMLHHPSIDPLIAREDRLVNKLHQNSIYPMIPRRHGFLDQLSCDPMMARKSNMEKPNHPSLEGNIMGVIAQSALIRPEVATLIGTT